jgi:uncharacterized cupin superfamily protein
VGLPSPRPRAGQIARLLDEAHTRLTGGDVVGAETCRKEAARLFEKSQSESWTLLRVQTGFAERSLFIGLLQPGRTWLP